MDAFDSHCTSCEEWTGPKGEWDCAICMFPMKAGHCRLVQTDCGHQFHLPCIQTHRALNGTNAECPVCRANLRKVEFLEGHGLSVDNIVPKPTPPAAATAHRPKSRRLQLVKDKDSKVTTVVIKTNVISRNKLPSTEEMLKLPSIVRHVNMKVREAKNEMSSKWAAERVVIATKIDDMKTQHARQVHPHTCT